MPDISPGKRTALSVETHRHLHCSPHMDTAQNRMALTLGTIPEASERSTESSSLIQAATSHAETSSLLENAQGLHQVGPQGMYEVRHQPKAMLMIVRTRRVSAACLHILHGLPRQSILVAFMLFVVCQCPEIEDNKVSIPSIGNAQGLHLGTWRSWHSLTRQGFDCL